jgi:hypothetical protein
MKKTLLLPLLFIGLLFIMIDIVKSTHKCKNKVIYRYIPKTFEEEQNSDVMVSDIFKTMFSRPSPWINSITDSENKDKKSINDYYISQS